MLELCWNEGDEMLRERAKMSEEIVMFFTNGHILMILT